MIGRRTLLGWIGAAWIGVMLVLSAGAAEAQMTLRRGNGADPRTLDPHRATAIPDTHVVYDLFEGLVTRDSKGGVIPGVAERWEVAEEGTVYTFHLRTNARWSNGDPVTADDFVYSLRRALDRTATGEAAPLLFGIRHADEVMTGTRPPTVLGVEARDPRTLVIRLKVPAPTLLQRLALPIAMPVHRASQTEFKEQWAEPGKLVSNGAFVLTDRRPGKYVGLTRNPQFHDAANVRFDRVLHITTPNRNSELRWFQSGQLDTTAEVPAEQAKALAAAYPKEFWNKPFIGTYYYVFNLTREPFADNPDLRQALFLAVDRQKLVDEVTQTSDEPAWGLVPPDIPGYTAPALGKELSPTQRVETARKLFKTAGYGPKRPLSFELKFNKSDNHRKVAEAIVAMWREVFGGDAISVLLVAEEWAAFTKSRDTRDFQLARAAWIGDLDDPTSFLDLFASVPGIHNHGGYANPRYDLQSYRQTFVADPAARMKALAEAEKLLLTDLPLLPLYHYRTRYLVSQKLKGWEWNMRDIHPSRFLSFGP
ncbi:MAG TPA: peptide ABC transporter substrate-binding protein [Azospirillaceae bacterium]|nr:peptide ABC transporter substrate-binding protein [Azospirillaceae bacterium]